MSVVHVWGCDCVSISRGRWVCFLVARRPQCPHTCPPACLTVHICSHHTAIGSFGFQVTRRGREGRDHPMCASPTNPVHLFFPRYCSTAHTFGPEMHNSVNPGAYILNPGEVVALLSQPPGQPGKKAGWILGHARAGCTVWPEQFPGWAHAAPKHRKWIASSEEAPHPLLETLFVFPARCSPPGYGRASQVRICGCAGFPYLARPPNMSLP